MFTRLYHKITTFFSYFKNQLYQYVENKIRAKFILSSSGNVHIVRIAPRNTIAIVHPDKMPVQSARKLLKKIMSASDDKARNFYDFLTFYTGIIPFLSMSNEKAMPIRSKRIIPYLHAMFSNINYAEEMKILIKQLRDNSNQKSNIDIIRDHFLALFTQSLIGVQFPAELKELLFKFEDFNMQLYGFLPGLARNVYAFMPSIKKLRNTYDNAIRIFLINAIRQIKNNSIQGATNKNFLTDIISEKMGDIDDITDKQISVLANDPEVRMCIAIVLGTANLTRVMRSLLLNLKPATIEKLIVELKSQTPTIDDASPKSLLDKVNMPFLHASYLEALRYGLTNLSILRNVESEIQVDDVSIPSHSLVVYPLDLSSLMGDTFYKASEFWPERFIDYEGQLKNDFQLHQGLFTPFGLGARMCPGQYIAELIIKLYLVTMLPLIREFNENNFVFYDEKKGDTARKRVFPLLKNRIKYSLFDVQFELQNQEIAEEIAENIGSYCL